MSNNQKVQLSVIGNIYVGKSTIIFRIKENLFYPTLPVGVAPDFVNVKYRLNNRDINLQIIDMHGSCLQDQNSLSISFIKHSQSVLVGFAFDDKASLDSIDYWLKRCLETVRESTPILIVANKLDLISEQQFEKKKNDINFYIQATLKEFSEKDHKIEINLIKNKEDYFFPVSAKDRTGIDDLVKAWVTEAIKMSKDPSSVILTDGKKKKRRCC
ncbi:hypothetical protein pb186bvf_011498 [Paramecium bursaria]